MMSATPVFALYLVTGLPDLVKGILQFLRFNADDFGDLSQQSFTLPAIPIFGQHLTSDLFKGGL